MNLPDKIYIREYPDGIARFWEGKKKDDVVATILHEYIRKDALLEWIEETRAIPHENAIARDLAFQEVVNKLKTMM